MNSDFRDLLAEFNAAGVEFLVVGAHALAAHGLVRATKDLDLWIRPTAPNAVRILEALRRFGAPLHDLTPHDLAEPGVVFQIGVEPVRIDLLTDIDGVTYENAWSGRLQATFGDQIIAVIGRAELIQNKRAAGRDQDLVDVRWLERHRPNQ